MEIQRDSISFDSSKSSGPRVSPPKTITFSGPIKQAVALLTGTDFGFSPSDGDHHLGLVEIKVDASVQPNTPQVQVTATLGVRDWSASGRSDFNNPYFGTVYFAVLAELA